MGVCAQAQLPVPMSDAQANAELSRIEIQRNVLEARYSKEESGCYQRFATNDCLLEVRARKRVNLEELRRQEIALNDAKRKTRTLELAKQAEEKTSPAALQQEADRREAAQIQHKERADRTQQKKVDALAKEKQTGALKDQPPTPATLVKKPSGEEQKAFDEKQRLAKERKAQRNQSLAEKKGKAINPLPVQP